MSVKSVQNADNKSRARSRAPNQHLRPKATSQKPNSVKEAKGRSEKKQAHPPDRFDVKKARAQESEPATLEKHLDPDAYKYRDALDWLSDEISQKDWPYSQNKAPKTFHLGQFEDTEHRKFLKEHPVYGKRIMNEEVDIVLGQEAPGGVKTDYFRVAEELRWVEKQIDWAKTSTALPNLSGLPPPMGEFGDVLQILEANFRTFDGVGRHSWKGQKPWNSVITPGEVYGMLNQQNASDTLKTPGNFFKAHPEYASKVFPDNWHLDPERLDELMAELDVPI